MAEKKSLQEKYPEYEAVIGMEVHVQLNTKSKIFCSCDNAVSKNPNKNICNICSGYPGVLPVLNKKVVDNAISLGLSTNCVIAQKSSFDRKHYFYPDLPKGYQITQQYHPICKNGFISIRLEDGSIKNIRINRIHIEEDAGKNMHSNISNESFVDLNRAGTPLLEIVSEPNISSVHEIRAYLKSLRAIVQYLGICSGNMEEGAFRADTNISVRKKGETSLGTKCELKNINSFKFISDATEYEIERQIKLIKNGESIQQQTRLWDTKNKKTVVMRTKEESADYRFFEDPDLPIIQVNNEWIAHKKKLLPELPHDKFNRLVKVIGLTVKEAEILVNDKELADYFENTQKHTKSKLVINWLLRDIVAYCKEEKISIYKCPVTPERLAQLIELIENETINSRSAKDVFAHMLTSERDPQTIVDEEELKQIGSANELSLMIKEIIAANPAQVEQYKAGKDKLFRFFVGQMMKKTEGKANPTLINELLKKHLSE